jgi:transcription elongation factor Elf1
MHDARMRPTDEKLEAYRAAKDLLARQDESAQRYIALELRRCIESIVYEKLEVYQKWLSEKLMRTWQPPQAFRALLEIDPGAQHDAVIAVAIQERPDGPPKTEPKVIGVDRRPNVKWLTDVWNKLSAYLHADWPFSRTRNRGDRGEFYQRVLTELEPFVVKTFTMAASNTIAFECSECGETVVISPAGLEAAGHATCLNCWVRYSHREENGQPMFYPLDPFIECPECHQRVYVPSTELKEGYELKCRNCKLEFKAVIERWAFDPIAPLPTGQP